MYKDLINEQWCRELLKKEDLDYNKFYKRQIEVFLDVARKDNKELQEKYDEILKDCVKLRERAVRYKLTIENIVNQLSYLETYSSEEDVFNDMKKRLNTINKIIIEHITKENEYGKNNM